MPTDVHEKHLSLTPQEIAHELRVDVASIYRAVRRGDLPAVRLSEHGALRIPRSALEPDEEKDEADRGTHLRRLRAPPRRRPRA